MAGGANKQFLASPTTWLRHNVIICDINSRIAESSGGAVATMKMKYEAGAVVDCDLVKSNDSAHTSSGKAVPVFTLVEAKGKANAFSHRFKAYYLPFRSNAIRTMRLDPALFPPGADFFFTDTINGCTVCAGPGANPKVGHFNRTVGGDDSANIDQTAIDNDITSEFSGGTIMKLSKGTYKAGVGDAATILGVKWMGAWSFYWQKREWVGASAAKGKDFKVDLTNLNIADAFG